MKTTDLTINAKKVAKLIEGGVIRQRFLRVTKEAFQSFKVIDVNFRNMKSFRGGEVEMPILTFQGEDGNRLEVFGSMLLNAIVMDAEVVDIPKVKNEENLPVYFRDDFDSKFKHLKTVSDHRNDDGSLTFWESYNIEGAIVSRSKTNKDRWSLSNKHFYYGEYFLEYKRKSDPKATWISEEEIVEISKISSDDDRTFIASNGQSVTLPKHSDLKFRFNSDTDISLASAQFIVTRKKD